MGALPHKSKVSDKVYPPDYVPVSKVPVIHGNRIEKTVVFLGDAILEKSQRKFQIIDRVRDELVHRHHELVCNIINCSEVNSRIIDIRDKIEQNIASWHAGKI